MLSIGMEKMVKALVGDLGSGEGVLILTRSTSEMVAVAKYADRIVKRARNFSRVTYENDDCFLFTLSFTVSEPSSDEPADLWVASILDATPDDLSAMTDGYNVTESVAWPDQEGVYVVLPYDDWEGVWFPDAEEGDPGPVRDPLPLFRPSEVVRALQFDVGKPEGWTPPGPQVSVWEHLRRNLTIDVRGR